MRCDCSECRNSEIPAPDHPFAGAWMAGHWKLWRGQLVMVCPPGTARGAMNLRNRNRDIHYDITCWPKDKRHLLTTGADTSRVEALKIKGVFDYIGRIIGLRGDRAAAWVEEWQKEATRLVAIREKLRTSKIALEKRDGFWTVRGRTREGVQTSEQRKFRAWEQAAAYIRELERGEREHASVMGEAKAKSNHGQ